VLHSTLYINTGLLRQHKICSGSQVCNTNAPMSTSQAKNYDI